MAQESKRAITRTQTIVTIVILIVVIGAASAAYFTNMGSPTTTTAAPVTLYYGDTTDPSTLDPHLTLDYASAKVEFAIYEGLVAYKGETTEVEPRLATSWDISSDGFTYTFHLRQNVLFHDGTKFNADAVKFSFDRLLSLNRGPVYLFSALDHVEVVDEYTVKFVLKEASPSFLYSCGAAYGGLIISPAAIKEHAVDNDQAEKWLNDHAVGTGPYEFVSWEPGVQVVVTKFDQYWRGWEGKHVDKIVYRVVRESSSRKLMVMKGDLDIAQEIAPEDFQELENAAGVNLVLHPTLNTAYVMMNNLRKPLDDVQVRRAVSYAFDYESYVESIMKGTAQQMQGPLPRGLWSHDDSLSMYTYDIAKAKQLLADAGYPNGGFSLEITYVSGRDGDRAMCEILQNGLNQLGIQLEITALPWPTMKARAMNPDTAPDMIVFYWLPDIPDPDNWLYSMFHSDSWGPANWNIAYYKNAQVDAILKEARTTTGPRR